MASLTEVAKDAGVSIATASMVLNRGKRADRISQPCAERVRASARKLGYVPNYHARSMKLGRAEVIGVAMDIIDTGEPHSLFGNSYFGVLIGGIELTVRKHGYSVTIIGPEKSASAPARGVNAIQQRRFDGLIIPAVTLERKGDPVLTDPPDVPIVAIETDVKTRLPVVDWDEAAGMAQAAEHLAGLGHRDVLWMGLETTLDSRHAHPRERAFKTEGRKAGLRVSVLRFPDADYEKRSPEEQLIDHAAEALTRHAARKDRPPFTAIMAYNDITAIGAYTALQRAGVSVPDDVSVIGVDDLQAPLMVPRLTTVNHMLLEMGETATELLLQMVRKPQQRRKLAGTRQVITPHLVVRASTAPPKGR